MGTDIHPYVERRNPSTGKWEMVKVVCPFSWRSYSLFGFLANVNNWSECEPLSDPRGIPDDISEEVRGESDSWGNDGLSHSWLTLTELLAFDYDKMFWDKRHDVGREDDKLITYREHLGEGFFSDLEELKTLGEPENVRVVFWFDC